MRAKDILEILVPIFCVLVAWRVTPIFWRFFKVWFNGLRLRCSAQPIRQLSEQEREHKRGKATVTLYGLGVHSVIDHLGELDTCLADISLRRLKGEKP